MEYVPIQSLVIHAPAQMDLYWAVIKELVQVIVYKLTFVLIIHLTSPHSLFNPLWCEAPLPFSILHLHFVLATLLQSVVSLYNVMSSARLLFGPLLLFPFLGCFSVSPFVHTDESCPSQFYSCICKQDSFKILTNSLK